MNGTIKHTLTLLAALLLPLSGKCAGAPSQPDKPIRVALYADEGAGRPSSEGLVRCLGEMPDIAWKKVKITEMSGEGLGNYDVLIMPGGGAAQPKGALKAEGREAVRRFVEQGGGYVGFCAGAYLAACRGPFTFFNILNAYPDDAKHWMRGMGSVRVRLDAQGQKFFGSTEESVEVHYGNGPLLKGADDPNLPAFETLATFASEIVGKGAPPGVMLGCPAIVRAPYGKGRVFCLAVHPEMTPSHDEFVWRAIRWAAGRPSQPVKLASAADTLSVPKPKRGPVPVLSDATPAAPAPAAPTTGAAARRSPRLPKAPGQFKEFDYDTGGHNVHVWVYVPSNGTVDSPIIMVMHGVNRRGDWSIEPWIPIAEQHKSVILCPEFTSAEWPGSRGYHFGNIHDRQGNPVPEAQWAYTAIDGLFDRYCADSGNKSKDYFLFGHSAGSQFVHRLILLRPNAKYKIAVTANAGTYSMPDLTKEWPAGLKGTPVTADSLRCSLGRNIVVLLGEADTKVDSQLDTEPWAMAEGANRYERGQNFYKTAQAAAQQLNTPFNWQLRTVPDAGHSNRKAAPVAADFFGGEHPFLETLRLPLSAQQEDPNFDPKALNNQSARWAGILDQIETFKKTYPKLTYEASLGKTLEGRYIPVYRLSSDAATDTGNPEVLFQAGTHGNETGGMMAAMRMMRDLLEGYGKDLRITKMMDTRQIWIVPCRNLDAKNTIDTPHQPNEVRLPTRKTHRKNLDGSYGVDLNRNTPIRWGSQTADGKSQNYRGPYPLSELESQALDSFFKEHSNLRVYVDLHTAQDCIFFPYEVPPGDLAIFHKIAGEMKARQKGHQYKIAALGPLADHENGYGMDKGLDNLWAYYGYGIYGMVMELYFYSREDTSLTARRWYENDVREPLFFLIEEAGNLKPATKGNTRLVSSKADVPITPGAAVHWTPTVEGKCDWAELVNRGGEILSMGDRRLFPLKMPYTLKVMPDAKPGTVVPMELYMWTNDRQLSVAKFNLTVVAP